MLGCQTSILVARPLACQIAPHMYERSEFTVASYNIHKAVGADGRRDPARTAAVIAEIGADILALQEADLRFGSRAGLLDLEALRRDLGLVAVPTESVSDAHGFHGNLLLVRNALIEVVHHLHLPGFEPRGALMTDLQIAGQPLRVISAHLGLLPRSRARQTRALMDKLATLDDRPALLMGDLNEWRLDPWSSLGPLADRFAGHATTQSYPARYPLFALDRMMTCSQGELTDLMAHVTPLSRIASDHLPIKARLRLTPSATALAK
jgi:endonuclease/exonuclease/phosphatase family metal-dependent hydrolase